MAKVPLTPVMFVDEVLTVEVAGDRGIISFNSLGALIRVSLSRKELTLLGYMAGNTSKELFEQPNGVVIQFPKAKGTRA